MDEIPPHIINKAYRAYESIMHHFNHNEDENQDAWYHFLHGYIDGYSKVRQRGNNDFYFMGYAEGSAEEIDADEKEEERGITSTERDPPPATDKEEMNGAGIWADIKNWFTKHAMKLTPLTSWMATDSDHVQERPYRHNAEKFRTYGGSYLRREREY